MSLNNNHIYVRRRCNIHKYRGTYFVNIIYYIISCCVLTSCCYIFLSSRPAEEMKFDGDFGELLH